MQIKMETNILTALKYLQINSKAYAEYTCREVPWNKSMIWLQENSGVADEQLFKSRKRIDFHLKLETTLKTVQKRAKGHVFSQGILHFTPLTGLRLLSSWSVCKRRKALERAGKPALPLPYGSRCLGLDCHCGMNNNNDSDHFSSLGSVKPASTFSCAFAGSSRGEPSRTLSSPTGISFRAAYEKPQSSLQSQKFV